MLKELANNQAREPGLSKGTASITQLAFAGSKATTKQPQDLLMPGITVVLDVHAT
jgi:hypothetical protein